MKKLELLILCALIVCVVFYILICFNVSWIVVLFASHGVEIILGLLLGLCIGHLIYNEDNEDERHSI